MKKDIEKLYALIDNLDERCKLMAGLLQRHTDRFENIIEKHNSLVDRVTLGEKKCLEKSAH